MKSISVSLFSACALLSACGATSANQNQAELSTAKVGGVYNVVSCRDKSGTFETLRLDVVLGSKLEAVALKTLGNDFRPTIDAKINAISNPSEGAFFLQTEGKVRSTTSDEPRHSGALKEVMIGSRLDHDAANRNTVIFTYEYIEGGVKKTASHRENFCALSNMSLLRPRLAGQPDASNGLKEVCGVIQQNAASGKLYLNVPYTSQSHELAPQDGASFNTLTYLINKKACVKARAADWAKNPVWVISAAFIRAL